MANVRICLICRKKVYMLRNGAWYHRGNGSEFCHPGDGTHRKANPITIADRRRATAP